MRFQCKNQIYIEPIQKEHQSHELQTKTVNNITVINCNLEKLVVSSSKRIVHFLLSHIQRRILLCISLFLSFSLFFSPSNLFIRKLLELKRVQERFCTSTATIESLCLVKTAAHQQTSQTKQKKFIFLNIKCNLFRFHNFFLRCFKQASFVQ